MQKFRPAIMVRKFAAVQTDKKRRAAALADWQSLTACASVPDTTAPPIGDELRSD